MLRVVSHIERLLFSNDCVIIPGFGGFVLQTVPAFYDPENYLFLPARKEISFNSTLKHNDGLVAESYMSIYSVDFKHAQAMLKEDTEMLKSALQFMDTIEFGIVGKFWRDNEGHLLFTPNEEAPFNTESYGLEPFKILPLHVLGIEAEDEAALKREKTLRKKSQVRVIGEQILGGVATAAAAVLLFFIISSPVNDVNLSTYTAGFIPTELLSTSPTPAPPVETTVEVPKPAPEQPTVNRRPTPTPTPTTPPEVRTTPQPQATAATAHNNADKKHFVIIGSYANQQQANKFLTQIDKNTYSNAGIIVSSDRVRVYADAFDTMEQANNYIASVRNGTYKDAWVFTRK